MKIIIIVALLVSSCGQSKMESIETKKASPLALVVSKNALEMCKSEAIEVNKECVLRADKFVERQSGDNAKNNCVIDHDDQIKHCEECEEHVWSDAYFTETSPKNYECSDNKRSPVCEFKMPSRKIYCVKVDYFTE